MSLTDPTPDTVKEEIASLRLENALRGLAILVNCLAVTISWSLHKSVFWAFVHGFFGGFYIIYYLVTR